MANFIKFLMHGYAPDIHEDLMIYEPMKPYTKNQITQNINKILAAHGGKFKIGKTGEAEVRVDQVDYRTSDFDSMYMLYKHTSQKVISELEECYIKKYKEMYPRRCTNVQMHSGGGMVSKTAYYYLYIVI